MTINVLRTSVGSGKTTVDCVGIFTEDGAVLYLAGGDCPHIGAVAVAMPRPSLKDSSKLSSTSSVFTLLGHKDDEVARPLSEMVAVKLNLTAVVAAGLHVEGASDGDIASLVKNALRAAEELVDKHMSHEPGR